MPTETIVGPVETIRSSDIEPVESFAEELLSILARLKAELPPVPARFVAEDSISAAVWAVRVAAGWPEILDD